MRPDRSAIASVQSTDPITAISMCLAQIEVLHTLIQDQLALLAAAPAPDQPLTVTVEKAAEMLGVGRTLVFAMVRGGELPSLKIGGRRLIPTKAVADYIAKSA